MPRAKTTLHVNDQRVRDLLSWAHSQKIVLSRVSIGDVELELQDTRLSGRLAEPKPSQTDGEAAQTLYERYGGNVLADFRSGTGDAPSSAEENMMAAEDD